MLLPASNSQNSKHGDGVWPDCPHLDGEFVYRCVGGGLVGDMLELATCEHKSGTRPELFRSLMEFARRSTTRKAICSRSARTMGACMSGTSPGTKNNYPSKATPITSTRCPLVPTVKRSCLEATTTPYAGMWLVRGKANLTGKTEFLLHNVAYSLDGKKYASSSSFWNDTRDMGIVWDAVTGKRLFVVKPTVYAQCVVFSSRRQDAGSVRARLDRLRCVMGRQYRPAAASVS